ncbi:MAG: hypothetical protein D6705_08530 [Deltaproteobacteria bacterium]|nr:MAG: hypothetical protein D6705_08530 [Deltaproteobacteria bacterium]
MKLALRPLPLFLSLSFAAILPACDTDDGDGSSGGDTSAGDTSAGDTGGGSTGGSTSAGGCETGGDTSGQCQAYVDCIEMNCGDCNDACADFIACSEACPCGDDDCALECYNGRSPECVTCQTELGQCIQMHCLDESNACS